MLHADIAMLAQDGLIRAAEPAVPGTPPGGRSFDVSSTKGLSDTFVGILDEFRGRYVLGFTPQGTGHGDGWHRLQVRVKGRSVSVKARPGDDATQGL